jgi:peptidoglycan/LPS O-acetylase OafA/YrhL
MQRLACLDGLRGVLAVYVMISHMAPFGVLPAWVIQPFSHGGAAVDVFFMLSGLVILFSLERFDYRPGPFLRARFLRLYPVFLVVLALSCLAHQLPSPLPAMSWLPVDGLAYRMWAGGWPRDFGFDLAAHLTMTHGLFPDGVAPHVWISLLGPAWSLSTEWQFYALILIAGIVLRRLGFGATGLAWLFLGLAVAGLAWAWLADPGWRFSRAFLGNKAAYFALGLASVAVIREAPVAWRHYLSVLAVTLAICGAQGGAIKLVAPLVWTLALLTQINASSVLAPARHLLASDWMRWLGAISYSVYLVNEPVHRLLGSALVIVTQGDGMLFTALWWPLGLITPVLVAAALWVWVERPGQRLGRARAGPAEAPAG